MGKKRIQITSTVQSDATQFYERVVDKDTGKVKIVDNPKPRTGFSSTTTTNNPYAVKTDGTKKTKDKVGSASALTIPDPALDASQL